jgi:hypothetical protein
MNRRPDASQPNMGEPEGKSPVQPPSLPPILLDPRPVIAVCTVAWIAAAVAAFSVADLENWRPTTVAGLGLAVFGTCLFLWQRHAARSGSRSAQRGLR